MSQIKEYISITILGILSSIMLTSCDDNEGNIDLHVSFQEMRGDLSCSDTLTDQYGICAHVTRKTTDFPYIDGILDVLEDLHITWVRSDMDWYSVSSQPGEMDYSFFDEVLSHFDNHPNIHLLPIVACEGNYPQKTSTFNLQIRAYNEEWKQYVEGIVSRYIDRCPAWDGINEWDYYITEGYMGYTEAVGFQKHIYETVKKYNPDGKVLLGSMTSVSTVFTGLTNNNAHYYYDVSSQHCYVTDFPELTYLEMPNTYANILKTKKTERELWITETGYSTAAGFKTEEEQAILIPRVYIMAYTQGADKVFLYSLRSREYEGHENDKESHFGITHKDLSPKPAYYALRNLTRMLPSGSTRPILYNKGNVYMSTWVHPQKGRIFAVWTRLGTNTVNLRIEGDPHFYGYSDIENELEVTSYQNFEVGPRIIYIVGATSLSF